ncbi:hypothetical protein ABZ671_09090 [Micromonospora sp. NPDC006766]|uniref:hypothetical protein n=1 Tax=Micromonospora sp. NPDC006766 TaxID=3154778 RepID=UPI0033EC6D93
MNEIRRWRKSGHLERAVETAGGQEAFDAAVGKMLDEARAWLIPLGGLRMIRRWGRRPRW